MTDRPETTDANARHDAHSYEPVDCDFHDVLEAAATQRTQVEVTARGGQGETERHVATISDVYTRDGAEYVDLSDGSTIRLDHLVDVTPVADTAQNR